LLTVAVAIVAAGAILTGCSSAAPGAGPPAAATRGPTTAAVPPSTPASSANPDPATRATGTPGPPQDVATGLQVPWSVVALPDGSALITLRDEARLVRIAPDGSKHPVVATGPDGAVPGVHPDGEGGLLGAALSPSFATDHLVYLYLTSAEDNRIVRAGLQGDRLGAPQVILDGIPKANLHNGGRLGFGPDGMLYASTGDATDGGAAQDLHSLAGKILRLTPDGAPAPGNPFPGSPVWTLGHRNVQGFGWDAQGRMFASEFGQNRLDEINLIEPGHNYGWPHVEGTGGTDLGFTDPLVTWPTDEASPSGLLVTGDAVYLAALAGQRLWRVPLADGRLGRPEALLDGDLGRLRDVVLAPDGRSLWVLTNNTARGVPKPGDDRLVRLPLR
jgi:glucose/arabinose dehydrogenase